MSTFPLAAQWLLVTSGPNTDCVDTVQAYLTTLGETYVTETAAVAGARTLADLQANFEFVYVAVATCASVGEPSPLADATFQSSINGGALQDWIEAGGIMVLNVAHGAGDHPGPAGSTVYNYGGTGDDQDTVTITDADHDYIVGTYSGNNVLTGADFIGWSTTAHGQVAPPLAFSSSAGVNLGTNPTSGQYNTILSSAAGSSGETRAMVEFTPGGGYVLLDDMTYDWGTRPPNDEVLEQQIDYLLGIAPNFPDAPAVSAVIPTASEYGLLALAMAIAAFALLRLKI